ncbi:MAG: peptide chain release factor N(5)-glutamine methyltransferase [Polyangiaceae bacterium]|nr:peptide chain release factor N(5)-glutamine methyltransferase [Polyangiaceae bacterium]
MSAATESGGAEGWTIAKVLSWATDDFKGRRIETARLDAELLLSEALGLDRIRLIMDSRRPLTPAELGAFRELIKRRRGGEPMAYILGRREFFGLEFRVDRRVLIPRPDTEALVEVALERTRAAYMFGNALDLCTGSGCVAVAFAKQRPTWRVTATDISEPALGLAFENAQRLGTVFGMTFSAGDLFAALAAAERFDLITANPPYVSAPEVLKLDRGIREFEPAVALGSGADGLDLIRRIVTGAGAHLAPGGVLALEVQFDQADRVAELMQSAGFTAIEKRRDLGGHERVVSACWPAAPAA